MTYRVDKLEDPTDDDDEEPTWDALDWSYTVVDEHDEIMCICASKQEAEHIVQLLNEKPYDATASSD